MIRKSVNFVFPLCLNNTKMIESKLIQITVKLALTKFSVIKGNPSSKRLTFTKSTHPRHVINKCQDIPFIIAINYMGEGKYPSTLEFHRRCRWRGNSKESPQTHKEIENGVKVSSF